MRARLPLLAVTIALTGYHLLSFGRHGIGLSPYRIDLDVYRIGSLTWLHGGSLYGPLPRTRAGIGLPFSYPPMAAVLLSPLAVVPMAVAGGALTLASIALTWFVLRVFTRSRSSRPGLGWLLPAALELEPVRATLNFGQVNIVLMALVAADCLNPAPRWPRGALVGVAAAVKLTPAAFILFFLLRNDRRAAGTAGVSFAAVTGTGFILDQHDSVRYWTSVVFSTSRPGSPAFAGNQAISGVLARSGLDPHSLGGTAAWLALSGAVALVAVTGMRRALAAGEPPLALSLNALAALLVSPISWSHHWVWAAPGLLCLAVTGKRHSWRAGVAAALAGLVLFEVSPMWLLPRSGANGELGWAWWEQVLGDTYVIFGVLVLVLAARFMPLGSGVDPSESSYPLRATAPLLLTSARGGSIAPASGRHSDSATTPGGTSVSPRKSRSANTPPYLVVVGDEGQHGDEDQRNRLGEVERVPGQRVVENPLRLAHVGVDVDGPALRLADQQGAAVGEDDRVVVHVDDASGRVDLVGDLRPA